MIQIIRYLNTEFEVPVSYSDEDGAYPLPKTSDYDPIRNITGKTVKMKPIQLMHNTARKFSSVNGTFFNSYVTNLILGGFLLGYFDYTARDCLKSVTNANSDLKRFYSFPIGVALSCQIMKELYSLPLSAIQPIPTSSTAKSADFKADFQNKLYLFEAKGSSGEYQKAAIKKAKKQLKASKKKYNYNPDISIVISSRLNEYGTQIQITDPEFDYPYSPVSELGKQLSNLSDLSNFFAYAGFYETAVQIDAIVEKALSNIDPKKGLLRDEGETKFIIDIADSDRGPLQDISLGSVTYTGIQIGYHTDLHVFQGIPKAKIAQIGGSVTSENKLLESGKAAQISSDGEHQVISIESDGSILVFSDKPL